MKKLFIIAALFFSSSVSAQPVEIVRDIDQSNIWYMHPKTFVSVDGKHVVLAEMKSPTKLHKLYLSVDTATCVSGTGNLYARADKKLQWIVLDSVTIDDMTRVSSVLATTLCVVGKSEKNKTSRYMT